MLHWIGWIGLVAFAVVSVLVAVYSAAMTVGAARDGGGDFGFGIMIAAFAAASCLFTTATAVICSIVAYNWTPWE